jgi:Spx/MgsR family transcriptional regulator
MKKAPRTSASRTSKSSTTKPRASKPRATTALAAGESSKLVKFLHKPNCSTCRKARAFMEGRGIPLHFRDLSEDRLSVTELENLIGPRDHTEFLNTRNEIYRKKNMKERPPSRREAIRMMAAEPNLIRRPIVVAGGRIVVGFNEKGMAVL